MSAERAVCVYCGSRNGNAPHFVENARRLGQMLGERGIRVVYGGASVGLMGAVADAALAAGGQVTGIIPEQLMARELGHRQIQELIVVPSMHVRKTTMAARADAFLALPGGIGTLEELFEIWTWAQLGLHHKPIGLFNDHGYYDGLLAFLQASRDAGFIQPQTHQQLLIEPDLAALLDRLCQAMPARRDETFDASFS